MKYKIVQKQYSTSAKSSLKSQYKEFCQTLIIISYNKSAIEYFIVKYHKVPTLFLASTQFAPVVCQLFEQVQKPLRFYRAALILLLLHLRVVVVVATLLNPRRYPASATLSK